MYEGGYDDLYPKISQKVVRPYGLTSLTGSYGPDTCNKLIHNMHAGDLSTTVATSTDSPTTFSAESGVIATTNTPTAYSLGSNGVPTAIGAVCVLVLLVGLLVGLFAAVICLHSKRKNKKRYTTHC